MDAPQLQQILARLDATDQRDRDLTDELSQVKSRLVAVEVTGKKTEEILEYMKSGVRFLGGLGAAVRWGASLVAACIGLYYTIKKG